MENKFTNPMQVLIISLSNIYNDPRVYKQIKILDEKYDLIVAGFGSKPKFNGYFVEINRKKRLSVTRFYRAFLLILKLYEKHYWSSFSVVSAHSQLIKLNYDLIIANDIDTLPLAIKLAQGKPILFDAHEYSPRQFENRLIWRLLIKPFNHYLCMVHLKKVSSMITVCNGIAEEYKKNYAIEPKVVLNAPFLQNLSPSKVDAKRIRIIHHGGANPSRKIENMIKLMDYLDSRFTLDLMLMPTKPKYYEYLKTIASRSSKIQMIEPVPMENICKFINQYDIGLYILEPNNFNQKYALPNKLFEFIQARLAIAIGPSIEMAKIVNGHKLGVVSNSFDPSDLAKRLNSLTSEKIVELKDASNKAAKIFCYEHNSDILLTEISKLLGIHNNQGKHHD